MHSGQGTCSSPLPLRAVTVLWLDGIEGVRGLLPRILPSPLSRLLTPPSLTPSLPPFTVPSSSHPSSLPQFLPSSHPPFLPHSIHPSLPPSLPPTYCLSHIPPLPHTRPHTCLSNTRESLNTHVLNRRRAGLIADKCAICGTAGRAAMSPILEMSSSSSSSSSILREDWARKLTGKPAKPKKGGSALDFVVQQVRECGGGRGLGGARDRQIEKEGGRKGGREGER